MLNADFAIRANKARQADLVIDSQTGNVAIGAVPGASRLTVGGGVSATALSVASAGFPTSDASARGQLRFAAGTVTLDAIHACLPSATGVLRVEDRRGRVRSHPRSAKANGSRSE